MSSIIIVDRKRLNRFMQSIRLIVSNAYAYSVYIPKTVSPEAAAILKTFTKDPNQDPNSPSITDIEGWKKLSDQLCVTRSKQSKQIIDIYKPDISKNIIGNVPVYEVKPANYVASDKVIVHLHGGFSVYNANATLGSPVLIANATGLKVISVDYTKDPFVKWQSATDEVISVLRELNISNVILSGESAGGSLGPSSILKMRDQGLQMPEAVILWSPWTDLTDSGDSYNTLRDEDPIQSYQKHLKIPAIAYANNTDMKDPYVSPVFGDFKKGFPRTLIQGGTKDIMLSNFIRIFQVLDKADIPVKLDLYEGMIHLFQKRMYNTPESNMALQKVKDFINTT